MIWTDVETTGLSPYTAQLTYVGLAFDDEEPIVLRHPDDREAIQAALDFEDCFGGHNIPFDMGFLEAAGYRIPPAEKWVDTVLISHVAGERKPGQTALARLQKELVLASALPASVLEPEKELKRWLTKARRQAKKDGARRPEKGDGPPHLVAPYLAADVVSTRAVADFYGSRVNGQAAVLDLELRCLPAIHAAQERGVPMDLDATRELRDKTDMDLGDRRAELFEMADGPFNPNANRQIRKIMVARGLDLSGFPTTPKLNEPMLTQESLSSVAEDAFVDALLRFRETKKLHDYVSDTWKHVHGTRLYGTFRQLGTVTGRMSSAAPNLQNIPRSNLSIRYCIAASEGKKLVGADLDCVELRTLAALASGGALEDAFRRGVDVHQQTADLLRITRDQAKTLNFATVYGAGPKRIAKQLGVTNEEAGEILNNWMRTYPEVRQLRNRLWRMVERQGYIESVGGRHHYFPDGPNHMLVNRLVSGSCADLFKMALIALHEADMPIVLLVHDEVVCEVDEGQVDEAAAILEQLLPQKATRGVWSVTNLIADAAIHDRWTEFKELEFSPFKETL